jgi:hypothetical protein
MPLYDQTLARLLSPHGPAEPENADQCNHSSLICVCDLINENW